MTSGATHRTPTLRIAGSSAIAAASGAVTRASSILADLLGAVHSTTVAPVLPLTAVRRSACIPAHSAASITEAKREVLPLAAGRALAAAFTEGEAFMAEEGGIDESAARPMVTPIEGD
jgi:hypothetical protein